MKKKFDLTTNCGELPFDLSKKIICMKHNYKACKWCYAGEDIKEFINLIEAKVLMDWKGQNEFIDWLKKNAGEELI